jgi:hypothetical protein
MNLTKNLIFVVVLILNINITNTTYNETILVDSEARLVKTKFENYKKSLRPSDTVEIRFSLYLNQIITLIEQEQLIVLSVYLDQEWVDRKYIKIITYSYIL